MSGPGLGSDRYMYRFLTCVHVTVTPWHGRDVHIVIFGSVTFLLWLQLLIGGWSHFYMFSSLLVSGVHYRRSLREELVNVWVGFINHSYLVKVTIKVLVSVNTSSLLEQSSSCSSFIRRGSASSWTNLEFLSWLQCCCCSIRASSLLLMTSCCGRSIETKGQNKVTCVMTEKHSYLVLKHWSILIRSIEC